MLRRIALSFAASTFVLFAATAAHAESPSAAQPVPNVAAEAPPPPRAEDRKSFALELNPLGALIGRYSVQAEWLPAAHHAIVLNPHYDHVNADVTAGDLHYTQTFSGFGGELGYRFYTGSRGPNGLYVGPSLLVGAYNASATGSDSVSFTSIGGALDVGGQAVVGPGIVIGGGFGLQYTSVSKDFQDLPLTAAIIGGGGIRPRALFTIGYAF